jgi:hypothetical protein
VKNDFLEAISVNRSRVDSVHIGNRLQAGQRRDRVSIPGIEIGFFFSPESKPALKISQPAVQ